MAGRRVRANKKRKQHLWFNIYGTAAQAPCHWCGTLLRFRQMTVDHVVPRGAGGTNERDNLVLSCSPCNSGRAHRPVLSTASPPDAVSQKCLRAALALLAKHPDFRVMVGPPSSGFDTRHFWAVAPDGTIADPTCEGYPFYSRGKPFDLEKNAGFLSALA